MGNGNKNGKYNNKGNEATRFTSEYQPSPEAKSKGWDKRRQRLRLLDQMDWIDRMSMEEFDNTMKDIQKNPQNYSVEFATLLRYRRNVKFITDWLDRRLGKAEQSVDLVSEGEKIEGIKVEIINPRDDTDS